MVISDKWKTPLILAAVAVAAYLAYRWWRSRQTAPAGGEGTNLNSVADLIGGSSGPDSGIDYSPPSTVITVNEPIQGANPTHPKGPAPIPPRRGGKLHGTPIRAPGPIGGTPVWKRRDR